MSKVICNNCNSKNNSKREYCFMCGKELNSHRKETIKNRKNKKWIIIAICISAIVITLICIDLFKKDTYDESSKEKQIINVSEDKKYFNVTINEFNELLEKNYAEFLKGNTLEIVKLNSFKYMVELVNDVELLIETIEINDLEYVEKFQLFYEAETENKNSEASALIGEFFQQFLIFNEKEINHDYMLNTILEEYEDYNTPYYMQGDVVANYIKYSFEFGIIDENSYYNSFTYEPTQYSNEMNYNQDNLKDGVKINRLNEYAYVETEQNEIYKVKFNKVTEISERNPYMPEVDRVILIECEYENISMGVNSTSVSLFQSDFIVKDSDNIVLENYFNDYYVGAGDIILSKEKAIFNMVYSINNDKNIVEIEFDQDSINAKNNVKFILEW